MGRWSLGEYAARRLANDGKCGAVLSHSGCVQAYTSKPQSSGSQSSSAKLAPTVAPVAKEPARKGQFRDGTAAENKDKARTALLAKICRVYKDPAKKPKALCPRCWYFAKGKRGGPKHNAVRFTCYGNQKGSGE